MSHLITISDNIIIALNQIIINNNLGTAVKQIAAASCYILIIRVIIIIYPFPEKDNHRFL